MKSILLRKHAKRRPSSRLILWIGDTLYAVRQISCDPIIADRAFRLFKSDGTIYDVIQAPFGAECDCPDFLFRRDGLDPAGCKHIQALVAQGLIEGQAVHA